MRTFALPILLMFALLPVAFAQEAAATLPAHVAFPAQLITKLNSHKSKVGDEVKLEVTANLHGPGGVVVLPKGAKLIGTVTEVKDRSGNDGESELSFLITRAEWHGGSMPLHAAPSALTAPKMRTDRGAGGAGGFEGGGSGGEGGGGRRGAVSGGSGGGNDSLALMSDAMAREIKGVEVRETSDANIGTAFFVKGKDISLPTGIVITVRQFAAPTP